MQKIKPLGNRILVKPAKDEEVTKSGIVLPSTTDREKKAQGVVVALGSGPAVSTLGIQAGQVVVFGKYSGDEVEMDENGDKVNYKVLYVGSEKDESDVLAIIE